MKIQIILPFRKRFGKCTESIFILLLENSAQSSRNCLALLQTNFFRSLIFFFESILWLMHNGLYLNFFDFKKLNMSLLMWSSLEGGSLFSMAKKHCSFSCDSSPRVQQKIFSGFPITIFFLHFPPDCSITFCNNSLFSLLILMSFLGKTLSSYSKR